MNIFNLGTDEYCTVKDSIGWICGHLGVSREIRYTGGDRGWVGDSPFIFLDTRRIRALGWQPRLTHSGGRAAHRGLPAGRELGAGAPRMNAAIIGCGLIGAKRAAALAGRCRLAVCADPVRERARQLAARPARPAETDWRPRAGASRRRPGRRRHDARRAGAGHAGRRRSAGKHVLVEKPAARRAAELGPSWRPPRAAGALVRVGFNHRYHPALLQGARALRRRRARRADVHARRATGTAAGSATRRSGAPGPRSPAAAS